MAEHRASIVVIDDEEPIRKVLHTHLVKEGFEVILSPGGPGVFETIRNSAFDLVISDIKMPVIDGIEVLEYIKKHHDTSPVIMLTGQADIDTAIEVMKKGAFDYAIKPVTKEDLLGVIGRALEHRDLLRRNKELEIENLEYRRFLEEKVEERTRELNAKACELEEAYSILKSLNIEFVNVLAETIEAKDRHTRGHCNRMRFLCVELGRLAGLDDKDMEVLEYASLLHDLGKVGVNESVLNKDGSLDDEEFDHIKSHPGIGEKILKGVSLMKPAAGIVGAHHENYDGSGYPRGLKGDEIPLCSRIIAVADLYDAMRNDRPYRKGLEIERILDEMKRVSGTQLDPALVRLFIDKKVYLAAGEAAGRP